MIVNILLILGLASSTVFLFMQNRDLKEQSTMTTEQKNQRIIDEINKVFDLPDGVPGVFVVTDPEEFKKQYTDFDNVQSGDYLLFYRKARLNVLYRQSEKRVVKTVTLKIPISVELVGSQTATDDAETKLKEFGEQITVVKTVKDGITQSFVFDVDDDQKAEVDSISKQLGLEIGSTLPSSIEPGAQTEVIVAVSDQSSDASESTEATTQP